MIWIGLAIVVVTFYLIYKNYEARLVLALSGLVMAFIGQVVVGTNGGVSAAVDAFVKQLVNGGLVPTIVTVMGFGYVMTFTKCSDHLVNLLVKPLARVPVIVIPGAVIITWLLNIVLPSAAGIAAAVGVLLIPALIALKVRPVMAAAAVFIGTWGSVVSPGLMFNPQIADIAFKAKEIPAPDAMIVIMQEALPCAIGALVAAICLTIICIVLKEGVGSTEIVKELPDGEEIQKNFKVNPIKAIIPIIPLALLVLASKQVGVLPTKAFSVPVCITALMLMEVILEKKQSLGTLCRGMQMYPQLLKNVKVEDKAAVTGNARVQAEKDRISTALDEDGRILLRESGTEPVIRVMVEAQSDELCAKYVDEMVQVIREEGLAVE